MNRNSKIVVGVVIILILIGLGGWGAYSYRAPSDSNNGNATTTPDGTDTETPTGGTVQNSKLDFLIVAPKTLTPSETATTLTLQYSIAFKNSFCDFKGDQPQKARMTDFKITMRVSTKGVQGAVLEQNALFDKTHFAAADRLNFSEGFIERSDQGNYVGYSLIEGVEGCGQITYFYPISPTKTLVVVRETPFIWSGVASAATRTQVLAVPGVITEEAADQIFASILNSFSLKKPASTATLKTFTSAIGWKIDSPTTFSTDANYFYKNLPSGKTVPGTAFRIPASFKAGTNLSEAYVSVEKHPAAVKCTADEFLPTTATVQTLSLNGIAFTKATVSDAGAGNRYEETVYAAKGLDGCFGIRSFVHYTEIHNHEPIIYPFDAAELQSLYARMVNTFRFTR